MTIKPNKPNRTDWEKEKNEEKIRWLKRKQEEEQTKGLIKDFLDRPEEDDNAPTY